MCFAFIINHCIKVIVRHLSTQPPVVIVRFLVAISDVGLVYSVYFAGLHKLWYPGIRDRSTWGKFGAHGEHGDVFLFSNLGAL